MWAHCDRSFKFKRDKYEYILTKFSILDFTERRIVVRYY